MAQVLKSIVLARFARISTTSCDAATTFPFRDSPYDMCKRLNCFLHYVHHDEAFPPLHHGASTCSPPTSKALSYKKILNPVTTTTPPTMPTLPCPPPTPTKPMTKNDRQFNDKCDQLDEMLYGLQEHAAKAVLQTLPPHQRDSWLQRL